MLQRSLLIIAALGVTATQTGCCKGSKKDTTTGTTSSEVQHAPAGSFHSSRLPHANRSIRIGLWLGMSNNEILTPAMIDWIGQRASIVVLNAEQKGPDPYFDYPALVQRFKKQFPDMPVLLYNWAQLVNRVTRVGGVNFDRVVGTPGWMLKRRSGEPVIQKGRRAMIDITSADYRQFLPRTVTSSVATAGTDGIAFDGFHRDLVGPRRSPDLYLNGDDIARRWPAASAGILGDVKHQLGKNKLVLFNGLWSMWDGLLDSQATLLGVADGAAVEFFGYDAREPREGRDGEFKRYVLDILAVMKAHPDKLFLVFARSRRHVYLGYDEDYRTERYGLASYLLGMTPLSTFKYHAHFQTSHVSPDRSDGLSYYADYDLDLGDPAGDMFEAGGVYQRRFAHGLVAVAPAWQGSRSLRLDRAYYTPEGERREGTIELEQGTGLLLLDRAPPAPPQRVVIDDFEDRALHEWQFPVRDGQTRIGEEGDNHFLHVEVAGDALQPYHERRVQPIRSLVTYPRLSLRVRSSDPASAVLVRVEVDDSTEAAPAEPERQDDDGDDDDAPAPAPRGPKVGPRPYAVVALPPTRGTTRFRKIGRDIPYGELRARAPAPYVVVRDAWQADGQWHTLDLDLAALMRESAPQLVPRRIPELRILGTADVDDVAIAR